MPYKDKEKQKESYRRYYERTKESRKETRKENHKKYCSKPEVKLKRAENNRKWREDNKDRCSELYKNYRDSNRELINKRKLDKYENDMIYRFKSNIRNLIRASFINRKFRKSSKTSEILGCSLDEFKIYIESKFINGMNWDNKIKWQLDHIIPISMAVTKDDVIKLNHHTNFQPLWTEDNIKKSNNLEWKI